MNGLPGRFWLLIASIFLGFIGFGTVLPDLAPHVRYDLGGTDREVGFVVGTFSFVALSGRVFSGRLTDRKGRKVSFLTGLVSCICAGVAYLLPIGIAGMYLGRAFQGFGEACLYTGAAAWAVELAGLERSARALGFVSTGIWGGVTAGPVVGQWLGSFQHAAEFQIVAAVCAFALLTRVPEDYKPSPHPSGKRWLQRYLLMPGLAVGFVNVQYPVMTGFLVLHLADHGNSGRAALSAWAGLVLVSRFLLGGLPDKIAPHWTFYFGIAFMAVGLVIVGLAPPPAIAILGTAILGFGFSFPWASIASVVLRRTPSTEHGSAVSVLSAFYDLFVGVSSVAAGAVAHSFGYPATFFMAAIALGAAALAARAVFADNAKEPAVS